ncbi:TonB-dependent receptor domain-containing protein [Robiginitalea aurantiaca]|uniref:TonB-dependent receptor n=1 Tax=Robiginitalea aurantiaca TaxID=3056915 RepID=A0ABT7WDI0_9FLAO|nr:TonB-dependent receptor [Robiginitalea aurantiaca]MDM9630976.1 TonB-dependent receptor [Robiginitalea aurantiaca]
MKMTKLLILCLVLSSVFCLNAQEKDLGTETVTVVRSYRPTVSDAYKLKTVPSLNDSIVGSRIPIQYSIFSVPVASTFVPAKGQAATVARVEREKLYNTYASLGLGNYTNALADFYTSLDYDRGKHLLDVGLNHFSSRGDIDGTFLNTDFYNTGLDLTYARREREWDWNLGAGIEHRKYNWYGLPEGTLETDLPGNVDEAQNYFMAEIKGGVHLSDSFFDEASVLVRGFWDAVGSGENRMALKGNIGLPISDETFTLGVSLDYVGGEFENGPLTQLQAEPGVVYSYFQTGILPSLELIRDDLKLELGAKIVLGLDTENSQTDFYIYPAVNASYVLSEDMLVAYGGVEGGLIQNSYYDFSNQNPFISPTLMVMPTDRQYEAYLGIRGQLLPQLSYNLKGTYRAENFSPLFLLNPVNEFRSDDKSYMYGNSFRVFYDDVKTLGIFAELELSVNRNFTLGVNTSINDYSTETGNPAWNLPNLEGSLFMDYQIGSQWYFGASLFYVGEREDLASIAGSVIPPEDFPAQIRTLEGYFDANLQLGYHLNGQLSLFARASNLVNNSYQRWANFRVQGLQVMAGASYKFDL